MRYDIDSIKEHHPIEEVMAARGVALRRSSGRMTGRCPFHRDKRPSLSVYPDTRSFYCFGCGAAGDVIDFLRRIENLSFREAVERLADARPPQSASTFTEKLSLDDRVILAATCELYHETLLQSPEAQAYLQSRGIGMGIARRFRLGYSDGKRLVPYLKRRRLSTTRARAMGLLWKDGREAMVGRLIVPELRAGHPVWMIGRALGDREPKYRGLSLPKPVLGYERSRGQGRTFVTEGPFDWLTAVAWGLPAVALLGTRVRAERLAFLERARRVVIAFDNDDPGREAAIELASRLGDRAVVIHLPAGVKDLNDLGRLPDGRETFLRLVSETERRARTKGDVAAARV